MEWAFFSMPSGNNLPRLFRFLRIRSRDSKGHSAIIDCYNVIMQVIRVAENRVFVSLTKKDSNFMLSYGFL